MKGKLWTVDEELKLRELIQAGDNANKIAAQLGKTEHAVYEKARRLGLRVIITESRRKLITSTAKTAHDHHACRLVVVVDTYTKNPNNNLTHRAASSSRRNRIHDQKNRKFNINPTMKNHIQRLRVSTRTSMATRKNNCSRRSQKNRSLRRRNIQTA